MTWKDRKPEIKDQAVRLLETLKKVLRDSATIQDALRKAEMHLQVTDTVWLTHQHEITEELEQFSHDPDLPPDAVHETLQQAEQYRWHLIQASKMINTALIHLHFYEYDSNPLFELVVAAMKEAQ